MKRTPTLLTLLLLITGAILSIISLVHWVELVLGHRNTPTFCDISAKFNCDAVTVSPYSTLFGLPVASYGVVFYLGFLLIFCQLSVNRDTQPLRNSLGFLVAALATLASVALFLVSSLLIGVICPLCLGVYLVNILLLVNFWLEDRSRPALSRMREGVTSILSLIKGLFGLAARSLTITARAFLFGFIVVSIATLVAPIYILSTSNYPATSLDQPPALSETEQLHKWLEKTPDDIPLSLQPGLNQDYSTGTPTAPIRIVEWSDFECPACRYFYQVLEELMAEFPGEILLVQKNYPLDNSCNPSIEHEMHKNACFAARVARCAGEQGNYWPVAERIFTLPEFDSQAPPEEVKAAIEAIIPKLNLDQQAMAECLKSMRPDQKILDDIREGNALGVKGTPAIWINERRVNPASPGLLKAIIRYTLGKDEHPAAE